MLLPSTPRRIGSRAGFTLIELLVVIAIIAILVSLLSAGIFYAYTRMADTGATNDLSQLTESMQGFKAKYGVYPPSQIRLCANRAQYGTSALDIASISFINQVWPNINWVNVYWDGGNNPNLDVTLDGDQVLVYFLSGVPVNGLGTGFSANGKNPADLTPGVGRVPRFYDFNAGRLFQRNPNNAFPSYKDYYGNEPYLYFSAGNRKNGYVPGYAIVINDNNNPNTSVTAYSNGTQFYNPDTFQIICAGRDGAFNTGPYNAWTPANASAISQPGQDDMTNFYGSRMGVPQ
jgi:prepilin-type N-terminal cleavage/methylation domain-containing protein